MAVVTVHTMWVYNCPSCKKKTRLGPTKLFVAERKCCQITWFTGVDPVKELVITL